MSGCWAYARNLRGYARTNEAGDVECMRHSNASRQEMMNAHGNLGHTLETLRDLDGTEQASGTPHAFLMDCSSDIRDLCLEQDRLYYEMNCHLAMIHSPVDFRDEVTVGPAWRMGPREGDGGTYYHDGITGKVGRVKATTPSGEDTEIITAEGHSVWAPTCRLEKV